MALPTCTATARSYLFATIESNQIYSNLGTHVPMGGYVVGLVHAERKALITDIYPRSTLCCTVRYALGSEGTM
jgi:hypothetical protein